MSPVDEVKSDFSRKLGTATKAATTAVAAAKAGKAAYDWWMSHRAFTVTVIGGDPAYDDVHDWLLTLLPGERRRALLAISRGERGGDMPTPAGHSNDVPPSLAVCFDDSRAQVVTIDGHLIRVAVVKPESPKGSERRFERDTIRFVATTQAGQQAVVRRLESIVTARGTDRRPVLRMIDRWGDWIRRGDLPLRTLDSVVLRDGQKERIVADMDQFLTAESEYVRRAIPYHRGYLFDGPPGTGKTSLARALADHFHMDLWYLPLGDLDKDVKLLNLLASVNPRSVVLLEDVDVYHATQMRTGSDDSHSGLSLAGLLNALDGAATPHGLISILTTNRAEVLDEALIRKGRIDCFEHINLPDSEQAGRLFETFYGQQPAAPIDVSGRSTADIAEVFKRHMNDPCAAESELLVDDFAVDRDKVGGVA